MQEKFRKRKQQYDEKIKQLSDELGSLRKEQEKLNDAIRRVKDFINNSSCPPELQISGETETTKPLTEILDEVRDTISRLQRKMEEFKQAVTAFKSNFSAQNTFHFRTEFNTDSDYTEFAAELNEFISNKKIEEYTQEEYMKIFFKIGTQKTVYYATSKLYKRELVDK